MSRLLERLKAYADSDRLPMHMPGHKRRMGDLGNPFFIDITEIDGFDNLHHAEGILKELQEKAAAVYGSEETHYLINGSTAGLLAAVSGCTSYGGTLLMARNSHKASYHGALLKNLNTVYVYPSGTGEGINGQILPEDVEKALQDHRDVEAVLITSPTYDGIVSDVRAIARIVHSYGIPLIVDEAHGAHFPFSEYFPEDSIRCGADVVIHSLHKTLPSLTQTAMLHMNGKLADREKIRKYLTVYQSSSPSYVLMASLDQCMEWAESHPEAFENFYQELLSCRGRLSEMKHLKLLELPGMDLSKILVSVGNTGMNGQELDHLLRSKYHVELEMACSSYICAITTVADTKESLNRFAEALLSIDQEIGQRRPEAFDRTQKEEDTVLPAEVVCSFRQAEEGEKEELSLWEAEGRVSGDFVTLYPPGIPILAPGEAVSKEILERILRYEKQGLEIHGISEGRMKVLQKGQIWEKSYA